MSALVFKIFTVLFVQIQRNWKSVRYEDTGDFAINGIENTAVRVTVLPLDGHTMFMRVKNLSRLHSSKGDVFFRSSHADRVTTIIDMAALFSMQARGAIGFELSSTPSEQVHADSPLSFFSLSDIRLKIRSLELNWIKRLSFYLTPWSLIYR